ncbi:MAG: hypothetical protein H6628_00025 [Calditrichae bacterium]|nr:hypothetical protein [Calditrichia bacterium]
MPLKEIAGTLDIAEGTVKALLFRAIQRLQKALAFYRADLGLSESVRGHLMARRFSQI